MLLDEFDFPLGSYLFRNKKQRPKSSDIDTLDRQYNTLGGVQSRPLALCHAATITNNENHQQLRKRKIRKLIDASQCSPRASRSQCARRCVEILLKFEYQFKNKNNNNKNNIEKSNMVDKDPNLQLGTVLELRALDALLRCLRDDDLIVSADHLRTTKESWEVRLKTYSTSKRQWILRVLQKWTGRWGKTGSSLTQLRAAYQETTMDLSNEYDKLGQLQQLLLDQPTFSENDNEDDDFAQQYLTDQCEEWNSRAKTFLQEILVRLWSEVDSDTTLVTSKDNDDEKISIGMDLEELKNSSWSIRHWSIALDLVEHSKLRRREIQGSIQFWTSEWKAIAQKLNYHGIPSALLKIALAKILHNSLAPHWPQIKETALAALSTVWGIIEFRFYTPMKVIVTDLLNYHQRPKLLDPTQLRNEQQSLQNMLQDLGIKVQEMEMSDALAEASRMYEKQLKNGAVKNMIFGKMIRLLLIQVQQLKADLLQAFQSIDELVDANRLNVSLLAIIPAVLLVRWGSRLLYAMLYRLRVRDVSGLNAAHMELTNLLRKLEQLLILAADNKQMSSEELGEFVQQQQKYLKYLDFCQPPFPMKQVDSIYNDMQDLLPQGGGLDKKKQLQLLNLIHQKNADLLKSL